MNTFYYIDKDKKIQTVKTVKDEKFLKQHQKITAYKSIESIEVPSEYRLSDDKSCIQLKTNTEKFTDGELSLETFIEIVRNKRNNLLNECDLKYCNAERWSNMTDGKKAGWVTYKQELRDLPGSIKKVSDDMERLFPEIPA